jgi:Leucine Rich Repeat (LRR) protein
MGKRASGGNPGRISGLGIIPLVGLITSSGSQLPRVSTVLAESVSRPWRKYLRFSVRGLIVLVLVIGVGLGWIVRSARIQRDAVAAIEDVEGSVTYDWQWRNGNYIRAGTPWAPRWLVDLIGVDYFGHVTGVVIFSSSPETDAAIAQAGHLSQLEHLSLFQSSVSDEGLSQLKGLTKLVYLDLVGTQVTDGGLVHLRGMTNLSSLQLARTHVTDAGRKELKHALPRVTIYP